MTRIRSLTATTDAPRRRLLILLAVGILPWTIILEDHGTTLLYAFGFANTNPPGVTHLYEYLFVLTDGLPRRLQAWPASVVLYVGAVASATTGLREFEDPRLTAGLLVFAGIAHAQVAYGFYRLGMTVVPIAPVVMWSVAWWLYWPLIREQIRSD